MCIIIIIIKIIILHFSGENMCGARVFWKVLGCFGSLPKHCYVFARVLWVVANELLGDC